MNFECIIMSSAGMFGFGYLLLISPYLQNSNNYYIEFENENSLNGFRLIYKGKQVRIQYKIDEKGKIAFANNSNKLKCLAYADNSNMSNFTKYKVINYFCKWLNDNDLMSEEITATFENLYNKKIPNLFLESFYCKYTSGYAGSIVGFSYIAKQLLS